MKEEYGDENGREPWKEPDNWSNLMNRLSHDELLSFLRQLDAAIESDPDDAPSLTARGMLHVKLGDDRQAAGDFGRVIDLEPGSARARHRRALARAEVGYHLGAVEDYDVAIRLDPCNAAAHYSRGASIAALGDPVKAMADFDTAISLDSGDPYAHFNKGCAYMDLGDPLGAVENLSRPLTWTPDGPHPITAGAWPTATWVNLPLPSVTSTPPSGWNPSATSHAATGESPSCG